MKKIILLLFLTLFIGVSVFCQDRTIDSLEKLLFTQKEDSNKLNTIHELGYNYDIRGIQDKALDCAKKALALSQKIGHKKSELRAYWAISLLAQRYEDNYQEALNNSTIGLRISQETNDQQNMAIFYNQMASIYYNLSNYPEAQKNSFEALKILERSSDKIGLIDSYYLNADIFSSQGEYDKALYYCQLALKTRLHIRDYASVGEYYNETEHKSQIAFGYIHVANQFLIKEELDSAMNYVTQSLKFLNNMGENTPFISLSSGYTMVAKVFQKKAEKEPNPQIKDANYNEALNYYLKSQEIESKANVKIHNVNFMYIASIYVTQKKYDLAKSLIAKELKTLKNIQGQFDLKQHLHYLSAQIDSIKGNWKEAYFHQNQYIRYKDSLTNEDKIKSITKQQMQFEFDKKEAITKSEQEKKDIEQKRTRNLQYAGLLGLILIVSGLYYNNQQKQKAKAAIEKAYSDLEHTLQALKSTQTQLIQKEKLASLGELTAGIAHEIQNPLNFVNNFSELSVDLVKDLKDEIEKPTQDKEYIGELFDDLSQNQEKINHHGKRASSIVKGMLEHSRASTGERELTDINALADEYLRLSFHGMRAKDKNFNADYKTDFDENLPKINVVSQDIGRVLLNLINNAFYAVNEKKKQNTEGGYQPIVTVETRCIVSVLEIKIIDNGNGMPEAVKAKVFQPFFTTKPTGEGTGLGLSLAYDIVTKGHGGALEVESTEGFGTIFTIHLPLK